MILILEDLKKIPADFDTFYSNPWQTILLIIMREKNCEKYEAKN